MKVQSNIYFVVFFISFIIDPIFSIETKRENFMGWENSIRISNEKIELVVLTEIGPRIIFFGTPGGINQFEVIPDTQGKKGGETWRNYGGHRLWHAPESRDRTYIPDNFPIEIEIFSDNVILFQNEAKTKIEKSILIKPLENKPVVKIVHKLKNKNLFKIQVAPWALSVMKKGGKAILPLNERGKHPDQLLPSDNLILWSYTNLSDKRFEFGKKFIFISQDENAIFPQKIGISGEKGFAAYIRGKDCFIKMFNYQKDSTYPDRGATIEVFTNKKFLELETLGKIQYLEPDEILEHTETWGLFQLENEIPDEESLEKQLNKFLKIMN